MKHFFLKDRLTMVEFVSNVGGLLGLFIGFSLISAVEIVYWLTFGYAKNKYFSERKASGATQQEKCISFARDYSKTTACC